MKGFAFSTENSSYVYLIVGKKKYLTGGKLPKIFGTRTVECELVYPKEIIVGVRASFRLMHKTDRQGTLVTSVVTSIVPFGPVPASDVPSICSSAGLKIKVK